MSFQIIIIIILFAAAVFYIARMVYKTVSAKKGCGGNCKCGVDFSGIEPGKAHK